MMKEVSPTSPTSVRAWKKPEYVALTAVGDDGDVATTYFPAAGDC